MLNDSWEDPVIYYSKEIKKADVFLKKDADSIICRVTTDLHLYLGFKWFIPWRS